MSRLYESGALDLARRIRAGDVSSREVVAAHLARIDAVNGKLGAVTCVLGEAALAAADAADAADRGEARGVLHGVPVSIKEDIDCLGSPTTHGLPSLRDALPYADAPAVARLRAAGAIPIARTNLSELGLRLCADNPLHGRTRNPYDRKLTAGGSSSGDAVAVATGMVPLGLGGDMGGSLRIPAECCGVAALKPTTGRVPFASSLAPRDLGMAAQAMLALGPIARHVADLRAALGVLAGRDIRDPRSVDAPLMGPEPELLRAALVTSLPGEPLPAATVAAIERAGAALADAGWDVERATPPELERVNDVFAKLLATDLSVIAPQVQPVISEALFEHLMRLCHSARLPDASNYRLHSERSRLAREWSLFLADYPVVVGPNWAVPVWPIDADIDPAHGVERLRQTVRFIAPGNALGLPSVVLPMAGAGALPASVQIYADLWREDLCLAAAEIIEASRGPLLPIDPLF